MDAGFETIGNATLIAHDGRPMLVTDPWLVGTAYFGSWNLSHEIPPEQLENARACEYVWVSHGHPDHLSGDSLALLRDKKLLVPNHFGGRIYDDLRTQGFDVEVLLDREWRQLSPRLRVMTIPDYNQDAVLLLDIAGKLVINLNDSSDRGWGRFVRKIAREFPVAFLLALSGYGDADMINFYDEEGRPIPPYAAKKTPVGQTIARMSELYGARFFVPFSSMHAYQRADSIWASEYTTRLDDYARGFDSQFTELLPAFIRYDCVKDSMERIFPKERRIVPLDPKEFGDDWSETLSPAEFAKVQSYFQRVQRLERVLDFLRFRVGGRDHLVEFNGRRYERGVTFEVPRGSLLTAVEYEIFDDLLIGNFMKTTLHGEWGPSRLYPDFTPWVAKYSDNGRARSDEELQRYFNEYQRRDVMGYFRHRLQTSYLLPIQQRSANFLRSRLPANSAVFRATKNAYWGIRKRLF